jgi:hypothetical protein
MHATGMDAQTRTTVSEILSHLALARCLCTHHYNHADDELDEVASTLDKFIASSPP